MAYTHSLPTHNIRHAMSTHNIRHVITHSPITLDMLLPTHNIRHAMSAIADGRGHAIGIVNSSYKGHDYMGP